MSISKICLVCLCQGVKMYNYNEYNLKLYYEELMPYNAVEELPHQFCYLCAAMLYKFHKFKEKCNTGQQTLRELLAKGPITLISEVDRQQKNLHSTIGAMIKSNRVKTYTVANNSIDFINTKSFDDLTDCESNGSVGYAEMNGIDIEIDIDVSDSNEEKINVEELHINDEKKVQCDNEKIDSSTQNIELLDKDIVKKVSKEANIQPHVRNHGLHLQQIIENEVINNEIIFVDEKIVSDDKKKRKTKNLAKRKPRKKASNKNIGSSVEEIESPKKIQSKDDKNDTTIGFPKQKQLNPDHWLRITMDEEEAIKKFKARADNPKYLTAEYKCTGCYKVFSKQDILNRHTNLVHAESRGPHVCHFCDRRFKTISQLKKHRQIHYHEFKCLRCDHVFNLEDAAARHNDFHNGIVRACEQCGLQFRHLTTYYSHLRVYHRSEHVCTLCGASFVSQKGLSQHKNLKHNGTKINPEEAEGIYCERCDIKFETSQAYDEHFGESLKHADFVQPKGDKRHSDDTDEESDNNLPLALVSLKGKIRNPNPHLHNQNKSRGTKTCSVCGKVSASYYAYRLHHRAEHGGVPVDVAHLHMCHVCGLMSKNIVHHMNIHTRSKMFPCPTCGIEFNLKSNMLRHNMTHTIKDRAQYSFKCPLCEKRFTQKGSMKLHYRTIHLKEPYPKRNRRKKTLQNSMLSEDINRRVKSGINCE